MTLLESFVLKLESLKGKDCWGIVAGEGTGSIASLKFGKKILRKRRITNPHLSEDQRKYSAEYSLSIESAWRLDSENHIICSSDDPNDNDGILVNGLKKLVNQKIVFTELHKPGLDLVIGFTGSFNFKIFCNQTDPSSGYSNYSYFTPDGIFTVGCRSNLSFEDKEVVP